MTRDKRGKPSADPVRSGSAARHPTSLSSSQVVPLRAAPREEAREFHFSERDFQRIRSLIHQRAGISLSEAKQDMVYSRLSRRLRARGLKSFSDYLQLVQEDEAELEAFTNALTTNLTSFFREEHHFPILAQHVAQSDKSRRINIWCCAASSGEEPYSIAMTLAEAYGTLSPPIMILASDVDTQVLRKAEEGVYPIERVERLGADRVRRFFLRGTGAQAGQARIRPELRNLIAFRRVNLLDPAWPVRGPFDALFCRNVMIYFDKATQSAMLHRFAPLLRPDGLLFVGHSESLFHVADIFRLRGKTVYELAHGAHGRHKT
jgi:chemotaxis protein methyltransferase CheR